MIDDLIPKCNKMKNILIIKVFEENDHRSVYFKIDVNTCQIVCNQVSDDKVCIKSLKYLDTFLMALLHRHQF